jgi:hypothetical protein
MSSARSFPLRDLPLSEIMSWFGHNRPMACTRKRPFKMAASRRMLTDATTPEIRLPDRWRFGSVAPSNEDLKKMGCKEDDVGWVPSMSIFSAAPLNSTLVGAKGWLFAVIYGYGHVPRPIWRHRRCTCGSLARGHLIGPIRSSLTWPGLRTEFFCCRRAKSPERHR